MRKSDSVFIANQLKEMQKKAVLSERVADLKLEPIKKVDGIIGK